MYRMTSSLRVTPLAETLSEAKKTAATLGITRVTDTTWLDHIGIPVFASIRPDAGFGSLCVNAGKGVRSDEAKVGAYMEAIEFAVAERSAADIPIFMSTPRQVAAQRNIYFDFVDLCPLLGASVIPDGPLACVEAEDIISAQKILLPAELVFFPFSQNPGQRIFGSNTNGLCSGNSVEEATLHGICEVIERDVEAFNFFRDESHFVDFDIDAGVVFEILRKIENAGLEAVLRYTSTIYGLPYFQGYIIEPNDDAPIAVSGGYGLHPVKEIAAVRGLTEAAQSRLTYIHGGRDDLINRFSHFGHYGGDLEIHAVKSERKRICGSSLSIKYSDIRADYANIDSIDEALALLIENLGRQGIRQVFRVILSQRESRLPVVRVIVPKLESFNLELKRAGRRLAKHLTL